MTNWLRSASIFALTAALVCTLRTARTEPLARRYQVESFPTLLLLDRQGKIHQVQEGFHPEKKPVSIEGLGELLGISADPPRCPRENGGSR